MNKICSKCKNELDISNFHNNKSKKDGLSDVCSLCQNKYNKEWYKKNKQYKINKTKENQTEKSKWLNEYKSKLKCEKCGENNIACLDFHHTNPDDKEFTIARMVHIGYSKERIIKEINKCIILCSNCHRKLHFI